MSQKPNSVDKLADRLLEIFEKNPDAKTSFGADRVLRETIREVSTQNQKFQEQGGVFFERGSTPKETVQKFTDIYIKKYREEGGRPTLPVIADYAAEKIGLSKDTPEYEAMMMVAARAEMKMAAEPDYHDRMHYIDVTMNTLENLMVNQEGPEDQRLSVQQMAWTLTAAIGHDVDHPGGKNPKGQPVFLEQKSIDVVRPIMEAAGVCPEGIKTMESIIYATSPDGGSALVEKIAAAHATGEKPDMTKLDPDNTFKMLHHLADDPAMTRMALIVASADLSPSAGMGLDVNVLMSEKFTNELKKSGEDMDLRGDKARLGFLNFLLPNGFSAPETQQMLGENLEEMRKDTKERLEGQTQSAAAPKAETPVVSKFAGTKVEPAKPAIPVINAPRVSEVAPSSSPRKAISAPPPSSGM